MSNQILKDELALAKYSTMTDEEAAADMNIKNISRNRTSMTRQEVYENIEPSALGSLTAIQVAQLNLALSDTVDPYGNAEQIFKNVFGAGSATVSTLAAARVETISRADELGINVTTGDVQAARNT